MAELRNKVSQAELKKRLESDTTPRTTLSFYQYHPIDDPKEFRDRLFANFEALGVLGRVYVAREGINAQISVPSENFAAFREYLFSIDFLSGIRLNVALEDDGKSFWVLTIKVRKNIVADGIDDPDFSMQRRGDYLKADQFNELTANPDTVVVDMRNYYEYEVGHFENALEVPSDTFREQLPKAVEMLKEQKECDIIMYCTGGIRCEKASAYLLHHGFKNVYHLEGGIIEYVRQVQEQGLENKFKGKNFVFDNRRSEQISDDVISHCHQCGDLCDEHRNCENPACHMLFIQCEKCAQKFAGCCCTECHELKHVPPKEQKDIIRTRQKPVEAFNSSQELRRVRFFDIREK